MVVIVSLPDHCLLFYFLDYFSYFYSKTVRRHSLEHTLSFNRNTATNPDPSSHKPVGLNFLFRNF